MRVLRGVERVVRVARSRVSPRFAWARDLVRPRGRLECSHHAEERERPP
jgi:hypothetical protein